MYGGEGGGNETTLRAATAYVSDLMAWREMRGGHIL